MCEYRFRKFCECFKFWLFDSIEEIEERKNGHKKIPSYWKFLETEKMEEYHVGGHYSVYSVNTKKIKEEAELNNNYCLNYIEENKDLIN